MNTSEMGMDIPKTPEEENEILLKKINKAILDQGNGARWKRVPEFLKEYEPLKGKVLVMVDDVRGILEQFAPDLMVATDGNASFVEYTGQPIDTLIEQIMQYNPDIVVMDYHLSEDIKGSDVITSLIKQKNFSGKIVGFSSDNEVSEEFMTAGAKGTVNKDTGSPEKSIGGLASLISKE